MQLSQEQWFEIARFAVFPVAWYAVKKLVAKGAEEIRDAVDTRADLVAVRRATELRTTLSEKIGEIHEDMEEHERKDEERFTKLQTSIDGVSSKVTDVHMDVNGKVEQLIRTTATAEHAAGLAQGRSERNT